MNNKIIIQKLVVERCKLNVSHMCALTHLSEPKAVDDLGVQQNLEGLFEALNKELDTLDRLLVE